VARRREPLPHLGGEVLDRHPLERLRHGGHEDAEVGVIAAVVLDHRRPERAVVLGQRRSVRLVVGEAGVGLGLVGHAVEREVELDRDRLLGPQRAVVVEDGDPLGVGHEPR
jgi:hypothetical protein